MKNEVNWNFNLDEAPESELVLIAIVNRYGVKQTAVGKKWHGRWLDGKGGMYVEKPYAWTWFPIPPGKHPL